MKQFIKNLLKWIIPYQIFLLLRKLRDKICPIVEEKHIPTALDIRKYGKYKPAGGMGDKLQIYIDYVKKETNINVENVFEIGANFAQDADYLMEQFDLSPDKIFVFEAHPEIFEAVKKIHKFNAYNVAVFNKNQEIEFNIYPLDYECTGWSSIFWSTGEKIKVEAIRMDTFMEKNNIKTIDFLKIDVEGATYQVLDGFGERIKDIKCIQLEAEHYSSNEVVVVLYEEISKLLIENDFDLVHFCRNYQMKQSDSFWIKKEHIKVEKFESFH
jgi:FkbM family methyltransferase